jgi:hypothetical protein
MKLPGQSQPVIRIEAPVKSETGLGDVLTKVTQAVGIKACNGCQRRAAALNRFVSFTPRGGGG